MNRDSHFFATIITIGDELLIGQVIDTNSALIAQELNKIGISIKQRIAVGDDENDICKTLDIVKQNSEIVILTGGLGPTSDDITKKSLCKYFNGKMIVHNETLIRIKNLFEIVLKRAIIDRNLKQAEVPDVCTVLINKVGTAPGMMFEENGVLFFALPGVPYEMKWLMEKKVIPFLLKKTKNSFIEHRTLLTAGVGESFLAEKLVDFESKLSTKISLAYLPNYGMVRLRLSGKSTNKIELENELNNLFNELKKIVKNEIICDKDWPLELIVGNLLKSRNETIATAESCTGGYIAHLITSIAGSSNYYEGSVISYSYKAKENLLKVEKSVLEKYGAVSEQTVSIMAKNVLDILNTDYSIAVSGIMGPGGETPDKPIGTVWIAVASKIKIKTKMFNLRFDRIKNIELTATHALNMVRELIVDKH